MKARIRLSIFLGYILFIFYCTLIPFQFEPGPWREHLQEFLRERNLFSVGISWTDVVSNLVLFGVYGLLFGILLRPCLFTPVLMTLGWGSGVFLSILVEFLQSFSPARVSMLRDVYIDAIGVLAGLISGVIFSWVWRKGISNWLKETFQSNPGWILPLFYMAFWILIQLFPFYFSMDVSDVWHAIQETEWIPFSQITESSRVEYLDHFFQQMAFYLIFSFLLGKAIAPFWKLSLRTVFFLTFLAMVLALGLELIQWLISARTTSLTPVLAAGGGALVGTSLALGRLSVSKVLGVYTLILLGSYLSPFEFDFESVQDFRWIPFYGYLAHTSYGGYLDLLEVFFMWLPFGFLIMTGSSDHLKNKSWIIRFGLLGFFFALPFEILQTFVPGRTPAITDAFISAAAWMSGGWMGRKVKSQVSRLKTKCVSMYECVI